MGAGASAATNIPEGKDVFSREDLLLHFGDAMSFEDKEAFSQHANVDGYVSRCSILRHTESIHQNRGLVSSKSMPGRNDVAPHNRVFSFVTLWVYPPFQTKRRQKPSTERGASLLMVLSCAISDDWGLILTVCPDGQGQGASC